MKYVGHLLKRYLTISHYFCSLAPRVNCVLIGYFVQVALHKLHKPPVDQKGFNNCRYGRIVSNWEPQRNCAKSSTIALCTETHSLSEENSLC